LFKIGLYFILPFIFASVFNNYKDMVEEKKKSIAEIQESGLQAAFDFLDKGRKGYLDTDVCREVFFQVLKIESPQGVTENLEDLVEYLLTGVCYLLNCFFSFVSLLRLCFLFP